MHLLEHLAGVARKMYKLHVWQWLPGEVSGHTAGSLHYAVYRGTKIGRAFDAYLPTTIVGSLRMARFARHLNKYYRAELTECIYNGRWTKVSIKNGKSVPSSRWGKATWNAHRNHVHVAI